MKMKLLLLLAIPIFIAASCKKNQLKKPTDVTFNIDINRNQSTDGKLVFIGGTINLASFSVKGTRQEGDPISFSNSFSGGLLLDFSSTGTISQLDYDIPQGIYTSLEVNFETYEGPGDITIVVNGIYTNNGGTDIPVIFEFMSSESFEIESEDDVNSGVVVLDKDTPANAIIKLDPIHWFDILSNNQMENATLTNVGGTMTLLINEDKNENLYDLLADRVDESTESVFN
ncbi:MAG: hypothetical protein ACFHU9_01660 [Fluviicola sp.]